MFYYIIFSVLAIIALLEMVIFPPKEKKWLYITIIVFFILIGGLRWRTGNDWRPYERFYTTFTTDNPYLLLTFEPGFTRLVSFLRIFSDNFTFYLLILSILSVGMKGIFFYRFTNAPLLAAILFWGINLGDVSAVRQSLAVSLCAISTVFIVQKKPWHFLFVVFLATQIHVTSVIFVLAYTIYHLEWSIRSKYIWIFIAIIVGSLGISSKLLDLTTKFIPEGFGLDRVSEKAEAYMMIGNENNFGQSVSKTQRMVAAIAKRAILLPIFLFFQERISKVNSYYSGVLNLYTFGNILFFIVIDFLPLQRMAGYFYIFEILLFCIVFTNVKSRSVWWIAIVLYALFKLISNVTSGYDLLVPYIWIFSSDTYRYIY